MISVTLFIDGEERTIPFPETWNELTPAQLRYCVSSQGGEDSRPKIFCFLLRTNAAQCGIHLPGGWESRLNFGQAATIAVDHLEFLYSSNTLTNSPFKKIKVAGKLLHGPDDQFEDLTVLQMELAHPELERFRETMDLQYLRKFCSYLFHRGKNDVSESGAKALMPLIRKIPTDVMLCMYTWFTGCLGILPQYFPHLYGGEVKTQQAFDYSAFTKLIHAGAGDRNGTRDNIRRMPIKEYLFDLDLQAEQAEKMKQQYEKQ